MGEIPWYRQTVSDRVRGAISHARLPMAEKQAVQMVLMAARKPRTLDQFSSQTRISPKRAGGVLVHLEMHGWIERRPDGALRIVAGADCECPDAWPAPRIPRADALTFPGKTALYRLYGCGILLYVGISDRIKVRMNQHAAVQPWWGEVDSGSVAWYDSREDADEAETLAIAAERPRYNKAKLYEPKKTASFDPHFRRDPNLMPEHRPLWDTEANDVLRELDAERHPASSARQ